MQAPTTLLAPLIVIAALAGRPAQAAPVPSPTLAEIQLRAINHRFVQAFVSPQPGFIEALADRDFLLIDNDGTWTDRDQFIAQMAAPGNVGGASYQDVRVRLFGTVGVVHGVFEAVRKDGSPSRVRYTDVYRWDGGAWRLVSAQNTPMAEAVDVRQQQGKVVRYAPWRGGNMPGDDDAVLESLNAQYVDAFRRADVSWYDAHLAPDYVVVSGDGSFQDRAAALADFAYPYFEQGMRSFPVDDVRVRRFGDVALIHAENAYERKDGRKGVNRYTDIWVKHGGRWRCVAAHITVHKPAS